MLYFRGLKALSSPVNTNMMDSEDKYILIGPEKKKERIALSTVET